MASTKLFCCYQIQEFKNLFCSLKVLEWICQGEDSARCVFPSSDAWVLEFMHSRESRDTVTCF